MLTPAVHERKGRSGQSSAPVCDCAGAAAVISWLIPYIMERFWQLYRFQWLYAAVGIAALLLVWIVAE